MVHLSVTVLGIAGVAIGGGGGVGWGGRGWMVLLGQMWVGLGGGDGLCAVEMSGGFIFALGDGSLISSLSEKRLQFVKNGTEPLRPHVRQAAGSRAEIPVRAPRPPVGPE